MWEVEVEGVETVVRMYYMKEESVFHEKGKEIKYTVSPGKSERSFVL